MERIYSMFNELWDFCKANTKILAQDKEEMNEVFDLIKGCESYLEIGTSEGNSLYIFGHAMKHGSTITYVDYNESHTRDWREPKAKILQEDGYIINPIHGNCHNSEVIAEAQKSKYDVVFIDAGHSYNDVIKDAENYAHLATKYILFHDITMDGVRSAFTDWVGDREYYTVINSKTYGYGIVKV